MARKPDSRGDGRARVPTTRSSSSLPDEERRRHPFKKLLRFLIVVAVLAIAGYSTLLYRNLSRVQSESEQVIAEYGTLKQQLVSEDIKAAKETANRIANMSNRLKARANHWSWELATYVPVLRTDADAARTFVNVNAQLGNHLAEPITLGYGDLLTASADAKADKDDDDDPMTSSSWTATASSVDEDRYSPFTSPSVNKEAAELLTVIETAQPIVVQCRTTVNALRPPISRRTRDLVIRQQKALDDLYPVYDDAEEVLLESGSALGETVAGFLPY
ncbi:MAG: hypothetical protein Q4A93_03510 [Actinomycetota bacterium]|nr:hypothetical protein [Actinomycetota bacterium]